ncbi:MAG TPA: formimidoylglutamate deiminase [Microbacteriaceae bacterium]|nr:formimidoylglutamate deiminase [Microbacteriaceae bacterium]
MTSFWCENAIVGGLPRSSVRVEETRGMIDRVELDAAPRDRDERLMGLVLPGLANAHSHAFHRALRGRTHGGGGTFWSWRELMYRVADRLDPENYLELATAVFAEMALAGVTVVGEFHYLHRRPGGEPYERGTAMEDAVLAAAARVGIRITLLDALYLHGGLSEAGETLPLSPTQRRFSDGSLEAWASRRAELRGGQLARIGAAIHSVRAVDPGILPAFRELTDGVPVHAHVSEQSAENAQALAAWGRTPTELLAEAGLLGPRFTAVHGTHLSDRDIGLLGDSRSTVCFCPTTERDLADGIGPASALFAAGARLSLGSDQHAVIDPFEELRGLEMNDRLATGERGRFSPAELLDAASAAGYESLGWEGGHLAVGALCDLVAVATDSPRTAGAALDELWLASTSADVTTVVIGGRVIVANGRHHLGSVGELLGSAVERIGV